MALRIFLAVVHLLGLGIGLGAIWARGRALRGALDKPGLARVFEADTWWGVSALLLIGTGLLRAFAGFEKGSAYYLGNHVFWLKMTSVVLILALEVAPMIQLIRWRIALGRGETPDVSRAETFARISQIQAVLMIVAVAAAASLARGLGFH